jgi:cell division protein FtsL
LPAAAVVVLAIFAVAALQAYFGQEGLRASRVEREVVEAEERSALLRARVAELSSPRRLQEAAEAQGMLPAPDPIFLPAPEGLGPDETAGADAPFHSP